MVSAKHMQETMPPYSGIRTENGPSFAEIDGQGDEPDKQGSNRPCARGMVDRLEFFQNANTPRSLR